MRLALAAVACLLPLASAGCLFDPEPVPVPQDLWLVRASHCGFCPPDHDPPHHVLAYDRAGGVWSADFRLEDGSGIDHVGIGSGLRAHHAWVAAVVDAAPWIDLQPAASERHRIVLVAAHHATLGATGRAATDALLERALSSGTDPTEQCCCECGPDNLETFGEPRGDTFDLASIDLGADWEPVKERLGDLRKWLDGEGPEPVR